VGTICFAATSERPMIAIREPQPLHGG